MFLLKIINLKMIKYILVLLLYIIILISCSHNPLKKGSFEDKEQVIKVMEENLNDLKRFSNEVYNKFEESTIIENKFFKTFRHRETYTTKLSNSIFINLNVEYISINKELKRIEYHTNNKFGYDGGFYYSLDNNRNYEIWDNRKIIEFKELGLYFEAENKVALINDIRHGWYTEKICDNWYFFEQDFDNLNFLKYVYDDIVNMDPPNKFYQENKQFFEKYNPHNEGSKNKVSN